MGQEHTDLRRTRASLFYLVAYLFPLAAGLLISPTDTFHLLGSRAEYATTAWRLLGGLLIVLAMVVVLHYYGRAHAASARSCSYQALRLRWSTGAGKWSSVAE